MGSKTKIPLFSLLWENYPGNSPYVDEKTGDAPRGYENQCAIKVGVALAKSAGALPNFRGATVRVGNFSVPIRAQEMASWLQSVPYEGMASTTDVTGVDYEKKIKNRTGIIFYKDYWQRDGESQPTGDHIDLWNGSRLTMSGASGAAMGVARFWLGIQSGPGFSNLTKSRQILFWKVL